MEPEVPPGGPEAPVELKAKLQGPFPPSLEKDKKTVFWMEGVLDCFSNVLSIFNTAESKPAQDEWEVPFESITDQVYLGSGAQGVVFGGNLHGEMVAVKKLRDKSEFDIKQLRKLNHENIVRFKGISMDGPCHCVVMEYCQYGPLFEFLHSGACFAPKQIVKWAKEIAHGMAYLHANKIIHRDLKSPNILIADNLVVKVSDFGTCRQWDDVSATMSFTGTVAWMAPEVIRHEPCSERVDVWSYGVVLWELLTQEIPYKNLETHAIMWGVGTDTISLPIPSTCPSSLQILINQCWNRNPRSRPPFKIIAANLEIAGDELANYQADCFSTFQASWRREVQESMEKFYTRTAASAEQTCASNQEAVQRREDLRVARDKREVYEQQLFRANQLYMEVCAVRLQLEERERAVAQREKAASQCRCGIRKNPIFQRQESSSSDLVNATTDQPRRKKEPSQVVVKFMGKGTHSRTVSLAVADKNLKKTLIDVSSPTDETNANINKNNPEIKDTVIEQNGNIDVQKNNKVCPNRGANNNIPDIAQV